MADTLANGYSTTCPWIIRVPSGNPEPDSESDRWREVECGSPMVEDGPDGARCDMGHVFGNLEARLAPFGPQWEAEQMEAAYGW